MTVRIALEPYCLPLRAPWRSAHGVITERRGWLVRAQAGGATGYGDCAPLPEAGTESLSDAARRLAHWQACGRGGDAPALLAALTAADADRAAHGRHCPAADVAVETALLDLTARRAGLTLRRLLAADAAGRVAVNAMPGAALAVSDAAVQVACAAGYRVLKLKVGVGAVGAEVAAIRALAARLPAGVQLRLDANGAWDETDARVMLSGVAGLPIESVEEPLRRWDNDAALHRLQREVAFALALDESLHRRPRPLDLARIPVRRLVLKPAVVGGLRATLALATQARAAGHEVVLTGLIDSAAGLWATAQLAAALGGALAHGLGTADWLAADLGPAPPVVGGVITLPSGPGSGFQLAHQGH